MLGIKCRWDNFPTSLYIEQECRCQARWHILRRHGLDIFRMRGKQLGIPAGDHRTVVGNPGAGKGLEIATQRQYSEE